MIAQRQQSLLGLYCIWRIISKLTLRGVIQSSHNLKGTQTHNLRGTQTHL